MPMFAAGSLAACTLTMLCSAGPAPAPDASLTLTLRTTDGAARVAQLVCDPDGGTHPAAGKACSALESADGDFERLPADHEPCPMIYAPVQATAHGHWEGEPVDFRTEYSNDCFAQAESGGVFAF